MKKILIFVERTLPVLGLIVYLSVIMKQRLGETKVSKALERPSGANISLENKPDNSDQIIEEPSFSNSEPSPFNPDVVVLTKNLSDLPRDIVKNSLLGKVITEDTMFYYEDDPQYLGFLGVLRRLSYEHDVEFKDNVLKYILAMPGELALWKGADGKLKDFLFISDEKSLNNIIVDFYLKFKNLKSDSNVRTFSYDGQEGYYLKVQNKELAILNFDSKLYVTSLHPKYFPNKLEQKLIKTISNTVVSDIGKGFYKRLYNVDLTGKHSIVLNSEYLSFGYNFFIPSLKAIRLDFKSKKWSIKSLMSSDAQFKIALTSELWKVFPKSAAMCAGLPVNNEKVFKILAQYKEFTLKRIQDEASSNSIEKQSINEGDPKDVKSKTIDIEKELLTGSETSELIGNVVGACWYEQSTIFTPLFISKAKDLNNKKEKIRFLFEKFIGGLEKNNKYSEIKENNKNGLNVYSRIISSKYGVNEASESEKQKLKFNKIFDTKLAHNDEYLIFSPDGSLVDLAISTLSKKNPSVHDELKISNKNISYLLSPYGLSQLLDKYIKEALPRDKESVFRTAIEGHLSSTFKKLADLKSFGVDMPKASNDKTIKWEELKIHDL